jgi:hypothetical protein
VNAFDSVPLSRLAKKILEASVNDTSHIRSGAARDFADYQHRVGYLRGLDDALEWMKTIDSDLRQGK